MYPFVKSVAALFNNNFNNGLPYSLASKIALLNGFSLIGFFFTSLALIFFYQSISTVTIALHGAGLIVFITVIAFNKVGFYNMSRLLMVLFANLMIFVTSSTMGKWSGEYLTYLPILLCAPLIFDLDEKGKLIASMALSFVCIIVLEATNFSLFQEKKIPRAEQEIIFTYNFYIITFVCILIVFYFLYTKNSQQKYINKIKEEEIRKTMLANIEALINNTSDPILSIDKSYKITVINKAASALLKSFYGEDRIVGDEVFVKNDDPQKNYWKLLYDRAFEGEQFSLEVSDTVNEAVRTYSISFNPIREKSTEILGVSLVGRDITETLKANKERNDREILILETNRKLTEHRLSSLRSQMDPHFIFNALNSIQQRILSGKREEAYQYLIEFSKLIRIILNKSDTLFIPLDEEIESLRLYLKLEAMRLGNSFEYTIDIAPDIFPEEIDFPSLLLQPFVENAIWHGLVHKNDNRVLKVEVKRDNTNLYCCITDNGVGRKMASELKQKNDSHRKSKGLSLISEMLDLLNTLHPNQLQFYFHDLFDDHGVASGTRVDITMKLQDYEMKINKTAPTE